MTKRQATNRITAAVGAEIKRRRQAKKLSQLALAKAVHISNIHLCNVERGYARLSYDKLHEVARALGCKIGTLFKTVPEEA